MALTAAAGMAISEPVPFTLISTNTSAFSTLSIAIVVTNTGRLNTDASTELNNPINTAIPTQTAAMTKTLSVLLYTMPPISALTAAEAPRLISKEPSV